MFYVYSTCTLVDGLKATEPKLKQSSVCTEREGEGGGGLADGSREVLTLKD